MLKAGGAHHVLTFKIFLISNKMLIWCKTSLYSFWIFSLSVHSLFSDHFLPFLCPKSAAREGTRVTWVQFSSRLDLWTWLVYRPFECFSFCLTLIKNQCQVVRASKMGKSFWEITIPFHTKWILFWLIVNCPRLEE